MRLALLVLFLASSAPARECAFTGGANASLDKLKSEIEAAGRTVDSIQCSGTACSLTTQDATCPAAILSAHVWVDRQAQTDTIAAQAKALLRKLKNNRAAMTADERDDLLLRLGYLILSRDP